MPPETAAAPSAPATLRYRLAPVEGAATLDAFVRTPWTVFRGDPHWSPPLLLERKQLLSSKHNPYFEHARARYWLATRDGEPVGRISAQVDQLVQRQMGAGTGQFGFFDAIDDKGLAQALFDEAEAWLKAQNMTRALGPFSLSINEEAGLLYDGFDQPPAIMMGHARPYYAGLVEAAGYDKAVDMYAYLLHLASTLTDRLNRTLDWGLNNRRLLLRDLDKRHWRREIASILDIFNDAWRNNWGFVPMTNAEIAKMARDLKPLINPALARICEYDGAPISFMITLPDLNRMTRDLDGRLLPLGWAKLTHRLMRRRYDFVRVALMGVRKDMQRTRHGAASSLMLIETIRRRSLAQGIVHGELSWILEDNHAMRNILEAIGCTIYKRYRIYQKALT